MLVDRAIIFVRSGKGGDGHVSFLRAKYVPKGGPNGGDGGAGGDVTLVATPGVDTLLDLAGRHHWHAQDGEPGGKKQCHGANGEHLDIRIPLGTLVFDDESGELLGDLNQPGMRLVVARGGKGGFGNEHFKSPTNQAPRHFTPGQPAQERRLRMELKLIADVGLIGKPNAGKSTLLSRVTKARPKIADYPFTTLEPNLGIADLLGRGDRRLVLADIPGLIEGAHDGAGLGFEFLRHIERTRILVHLVEVDPIDGSNPAENYRVIRRELGEYSPALLAKPQIVALSKTDLLPDGPDLAAAKEMFEQATGESALAFSAATGQGLGELMDECWRLRTKAMDDEAAGAAVAERKD